MGGPVSDADNTPCTRDKSNGVAKQLKCDKGHAVKTLEDLQVRLEQVFQSDYINVEEVKRLMESYEGDPLDWEKYAHYKAENLTRNLVATGNGKYNLILVCWEGGHRSTVHDHSNCHCFMRQVKGTLDEIRYAWPELKTPKDAPLVETSRFKLNLSEVSYMNDEIGLHRMENASKTDRAVSLHLYCPPFGACKVFDKDTGRSIKCPVTFWSKYGVKPSA